MIRLAHHEFIDEVDALQSGDTCKAHPPCTAGERDRCNRVLLMSANSFAGDLPIAHYRTAHLLYRGSYIAFRDHLAQMPMDHIHGHGNCLPHAHLMERIWCAGQNALDEWLVGDDQSRYLHARAMETGIGSVNPAPLRAWICDDGHL